MQSPSTRQGPRRSPTAGLLAALALVGVAGMGCDQPTDPADPDRRVEAQEKHEGHAGGHSEAPQLAVAVLQSTSGSDVKGFVTFEAKDGGVLVRAEIEGLTPGKHGFHVHQYGDARSEDGKSAGGHFNPEEKPHALPDEGGEARHVGDLGNLEADESGRATYERLDKHLKLTGEHSILGRGVVVHEKADTGAQPTGAAGGRQAVGVIGIGNPEWKPQ